LAAGNDFKLKEKNKVQDNDFVPSFGGQAKLNQFTTDYKIDLPPVSNDNLPQLKKKSVSNLAQIL
jgi:hypothetical protein